MISFQFISFYQTRTPYHYLIKMELINSNPTSYKTTYLRNCQVLNNSRNSYYLIQITSLIIYIFCNSTSNNNIVRENSPLNVFLL